MSETMVGVGWVTQVQQSDGVWLSWTQFKEPGPAETLAAKLLANERYGFIAARVQRVDWTTVKTLGVVHLSPAGDDGFMPCCGRTPFEADALDRMTLDPKLVTCPGVGARLR